MNRIVEFYQINHLSVLIAVVFFLGIYILKLKTKILDYISKQEEYDNKKIRIGSIVKLKYILTGEVVTLQISEYQSGVIENQSKIRRINSKMPLAVSLLDKYLFYSDKILKGDKYNDKTFINFIGPTTNESTEEIGTNNLDTFPNMQYDSRSI